MSFVWLATHMIYVRAEKHNYMYQVPHHGFLWRRTGIELEGGLKGTCSSFSVFAQNNRSKSDTMFINTQLTVCGYLYFSVF